MSLSRFFLSLFVVLIALQVNAQFPASPNKLDENGKRTGHWTILYDTTFRKEVRDPDSAIYYRLVRYDAGRPIGKVRDFYRTGQKQWDGYMISINPDVPDGEVNFYFENGQVRNNLNYKSGKMHGSSKVYNVRGILISDGLYSNDSLNGPFILNYEDGSRQIETNVKNNFYYGPYTEYWPNGRVKLKETRINGLENGLSEIFHENGNIKIRAIYKNGKRNGLWEWYNENGILEQKGEYRNGISVGLWIDYYEDGKTLSGTGARDTVGRKGPWVYFHPNGQKKSEGEFANDLNHGKWTYYHTNGKLQSVGMRNMSVYEGEWKFYFEEGTLKEDVYYQADSLHGPYKTFYANGNLKSEGKYDNGRKDGLWKTYYESGQLSSEDSYSLGVLNGYRKSYHENGKLEYEGMNASGLKDGIWKFYYANGQLSNQESQRDGKLEGTAINYYENGVKKDSSTWHNGLETGYRIYWYDNDKVEYEGYFKDDIKEGEWKRHYPNGQLKSKHFYVNGVGEGPYENYHANGNKKHFGTNKAGNRNGLTRHWFENGVVQEEGMRINNLPEGHWLYYDSLTGLKSSEGDYVKGEMNGKFTYYTNGKKSSEGTFVNGKKHGKFILYENGKKPVVENHIHGFYESVYNIRDSVEKLIDYKEYDKALQGIAWAERVLKKNKQQNSERAEVPPRLYQQLYSAQKNYAKALEWNDKHIAIELKYRGDTAHNYIIALGDRAIIYSSLKQEAEALVLEKRTGEYHLKKGDFKNYIVSVYNQAISLEKLYGSDSAINLFQKTILAQQKGKGANHPDAIESRFLLGKFYYSYLEDFDKSTEYNKALLSELEALKSNDHRIKESKAECLNRIAESYQGLRLRQEAIPWYKASITGAEENGITNPYRYIENHTRLGYDYFLVGKKDSSLMVYDKVLALLERSNMVQHTWYAQALHGKAEVLFSKYESGQSLALWKQAKEILEDINLTNTLEYANILSGIVLVYRDRGQFEEAVKLAKQGLEIEKNIYGESNRHYINYLVSFGDLYRDWNKYDLALQTLQQAEKLTLQHLGESNDLYAECEGAIASVYYDLDNYQKAVEYNSKALTFYRSDISNYVSQFLGSVIDLASNYRYLNDYAQSEKLILEAIAVAEKYYGKESTNYLSHRGSLAYLYNWQGLYGQAMPIYKENMEGYKKLVGEGHIQYIWAVRSLARCYLDQSENEKAEKLYKLFHDLTLKNPGEKSAEHIDALYRLASINVYTDRRPAAEQLYKKALATAVALYGNEHPETAYYSKALGLLYFRWGKYSEAEKQLSVAADIMARSSFGTESAVYGGYITELATVKSELGKNQEAEALFQKAVDVTRKDITNNLNLYEKAAFGLAQFYEKMGRFRDSEKIFLEAIALLGTGNKATRMYFSNTSGLIGLYYRSGKYEQAISQGQQLLTDLENEVAPTHFWLLDTHNLLGLIYLEKGDIEEAGKHFSHILEMRKQGGEDWGNTDAVYIHNWSTVLTERGDFAGAEKALGESSAIRKRMGIELRPREFANYMDNQAILYQAWGKMDQAEKIWLQVIENLLRYTRENFYFMSDEEKAQFWSNTKKDFEYFNTFAVLRSKQNPAILGAMYNNQLATKAILLSASNKIKGRILNSGDAAMVNEYYNWIEVREKLAQLYVLSETDLKKRKNEIDSLQLTANRIEKGLNITAEDLERDRGKAEASWKDVQRLLAPGEAAVEIIRFHYFDRHLRDSVLYAALVLTAETKQNPKMVLLPDGKYLEGRGLRYYKNSIANKLEDKLSYKTFWESIEPLVKGKSRVYLSLDGVYNQINLNTLRDAQGKYLVDGRNFTIVSNTKDIIAMKSRKLTKSTNSTAALFGFPKYFIGKDKLKEMAGDQKRDVDFSSMDERDGTGINELPGTQREIEQVKNILTSSHWQASGFISEDASEKALKSINYPGILHIATHGFFVDEQNASATFNLGTSTEYAAQNPLLRSGVLLSGAANFIQSNIKLDEENGILTAYEAANLNLENTDLAVLSACETGKGEVQNGEGVYGLQRAFQTAGAQAIIMSLWKVDDTATQELMTSFYQSWMGGSTKTEAFRKAQLEIKNKYNHPYYWGAFVMMGE